MSNTLTPPREDSGVDDDFPILDNGVGSNPEGHQPSLQLNSSLPTPVSHMDMSLDFDEGRKSGMDARNESHEMTYDEDQDMSDGGVPLTTSSAHNEHDNGSDSSDEELDTIDSEMMGTQNLQGLLHSANLLQSTLNPHDAPPHYSPHLEPYFPEEYAEYAAPEEAELPSAFAQPPPALSSLPEAMSQVSQQLQHIQDGQAHGELNGLEEPQAHLHLENSTAPLPLPSLSYVSMDDSEETPSHISMSDVSAVAAGSINVPHVSGTEDWTSSLAVDAMYLGHDHAGNFPFSSLQAAGGDDASEADENEVDEQINLSLPDFLHRWGMTVSTNGSSKKLPRGPDLASVREQSMKMLQTIDISNLNGEQCDIQGINWDNLGVSRSEARQMRRQTYRNYTNLRMHQQEHTRRYGTRLDNLDNHFKFRRMDFEHDVHLAHFQLRNLLACPSRGNTFYAGHSQVMRVNQAGDKSIAMDLTDPDVQPLHAFSNGIQISTLTAAHDVLVAGGFCGEYGLSNLRAERSTKHTEGLITDHHNSITNHIQVHLSRGSSAPLAAFASNDNGLRVLDVTTNKLIKEQKFEYAINCSSISPDQRLRVLVGDTKSVMICNAETGEILQDLKEPNGHLDFGFACDWADDGWTVATGNQDMQIKIWDARKWTTNRGIPLPLATIAAEMAGVRKLKFSPLGSGKRVLVAAEPADFISVIDAETFNAKQTLSFFGEIGGVDFTNNGQDLIVANCDSMRGGIMEFERCDFAAEALYGLSGSSRRTSGSEKDIGLDWRSTEEEILWHPQAKRTATHRKRKAVNLSAMGAF